MTEDLRITLPVKCCKTCRYYRWYETVGECTNFTDEEMYAYDGDDSITHEMFPHESCAEWEPKD